MHSNCSYRPLRHSENLKINVTDRSTKGIGEPALFRTVGSLNSRSNQRAAPAVCRLKEQRVIPEGARTISLFVRARPFGKQVSISGLHSVTINTQTHVTLPVIECAPLLQLWRHHARFAQ